MTVSQYLLKRLKELELKRMFGVAGNYQAPFLDTVLEENEKELDPSKRIALTGMPNEICAGYAADAYART